MSHDRKSLHKKSLAILDIVQSALHGKTSMSEEEFENLFSIAIDMAEVSIHIEKRCLMAYIAMAKIELLLNKKESARSFCDQCLAEIDRMQSNAAASGRFGKSIREFKNIALQLKDEISKS